MGIAGGVGAGGWWLGYGGNQREVREEEREREVVLKDKGLEPKEREGEDGLESPSYELARFDRRQWQRPVVDPPAAVVVAPVAVRVPMVQLPPEIQLAGVLVGTTPESSSAFLKMASGLVEVVRVGEGLKARPDVVVT